MQPFNTPFDCQRSQAANTKVAASSEGRRSRLLRPDQKGVGIRIGQTRERDAGSKGDGERGGWRLGLGGKACGGRRKGW